MRPIRMLLTAVFIVSFLIISGCKTDEGGNDANESASVQSIQNKSSVNI